MLQCLIRLPYDAISYQHKMFPFLFSILFKDCEQHKRRLLVVFVNFFPTCFISNWNYFRELVPITFLTSLGSEQQLKHAVNGRFKTHVLYTKVYIALLCCYCISECCDENWPFD